MVWTIMLNMHLLSVNALVSCVFAGRTENILILLSDRNSEEVTPYIDIKSHGLRDILREVLHDISAISLMEDKPSVMKTKVSPKNIADQCRSSETFYSISSLSSKYVRIKPKPMQTTNRQMCSISACSSTT